MKYRVFALAGILTLSGCAEKTSEIIEKSQWALTKDRCSSSFTTFNDGKLMHHTSEGMASRTVVETIRDVPNAKDTAAVTFRYPDQPAGKNRLLIIYKFDGERIKPVGMATSEGYTLLDGRVQDYIDSLTYIKCS